MKNKILLGIIAVSVICIVAGFVFYKFSPATVVSDYDDKNYTQSDTWNRYEEFELGVNRYGQVVFKQPERALGRAKELGRDFIYKTKAEFEVPYMPDSYGRIYAYATLFFEMPGNGDALSEKEKELADFMGMVFSLYTHSKIQFYLKV